MKRGREKEGSFKRKGRTGNKKEEKGKRKKEIKG
jgi:hypothetical protein